MKLVLSNGASVKVLSADKFLFEIGGNASSGTIGKTVFFSNFAELMEVNSLPVSGSVSGSSNVLIKRNEIIENATITKNGELTEKFKYLSDYII